MLDYSTDCFRLEAKPPWGFYHVYWFGCLIQPGVFKTSIYYQLSAFHSCTHTYRYLMLTADARRSIFVPMPEEMKLYISGCSRKLAHANNLRRLQPGKNSQITTKPQYPSSKNIGICWLLSLMGPLKHVEPDLHLDYIYKQASFRNQRTISF